MKVYIVTEAQYVPCSRVTSSDIYPYAEVFASYEKARDALRKSMREVVNASYEGKVLDGDDVPDIDNILDEILETEYNDYWYWDADDRSAVWRIIEAEV